MAGQIAGILLGRFFSGYFWSIFTIFLFITVGLLFYLRQKRLAFWLPMAFMVLAGYVSIQPFVAPNLSLHHVSRLADGGTYTLTGTITTEPRNLDRRVRMVVAVERMGAQDGSPHLTTPLSGRLQLTTGPEMTGRLHRGDRIQFTGRLKPVHSFSNPGGFDYRRYLMFQGIHCRLWSAPQRVVVIEPGVRKSFWQLVDRFREKVGQRLDQISSDPSRHILKALVIGDRSGIDSDMRRVFSRCGVAHLLAISGLHVAIVATVVFFPLCWLMGYCPVFLRRGIVLKMAALFTIPVVVGYGIMTGLSPSTQRAVLMVSVFLLALLIDRWQEPFNTIAAAALVILVIDPTSLFAVAFQLSFTAVIFIVWGERLWDQLKTAMANRDQNRLQRYGWGLFRVSAFAYLGTFPLVVHYFNEISFIGIAVNLVAVPLIGYGIVPLGLLGLCLLPLSDVGSTVVWGTTCWLLERLLQILTALSELNFAADFLVTPNWLEIVIYYAIWVGGSLLIVQGILWLRGRDERITLNLKPYQMVFTAALVLGVMDTGYWYYQRHWRETLRVTVLDVGNGSANLVELPQGKVMLIDGGGFPDNTLFDVGRSIVAPVLWNKKIKRIDYLVLSHPNSDHLNGLLFMARHFDIGQVWQTGWAADTQGFHQLQQVISQRHLNAPTWGDQPKHHRINGVAVDLLWPPAEPDTPLVWPDTNNQSVVLKLTHGSHSILFPGDIERPVETVLIRQSSVKLNSTLLVAPHHGSRTSSSQLFLEAVSPQRVIVSSAPWGRYPFPHPVIRERYQRLGLDILETARQGAVTIAFKKGVYVIRTEK